MSDDGLGKPEQRVSMNPSGNQQEESLAFLESFTPFVVDDKTGQVLKGNIPKETLMENWELLNQHLALGNMDAKDIEIVYLMTKRNMLSSIATVPLTKFTVAKLREMQKVKMSSFLLSTKSKTEGERDRKLIPAVVSLTESRSSFKEEVQKQKAKSFGGFLNPLNWR